MQLARPLVSWPGIDTGTMAVKVIGPDHWIARKIPQNEHFRFLIKRSSFDPFYSHSSDDNVIWRHLSQGLSDLEFLFWTWEVIEWFLGLFFFFFWKWPVYKLPGLAWMWRFLKQPVVYMCSSVHFSSSSFGWYFTKISSNLLILNLPTLLMGFPPFSLTFL